MEWSPANVLVTGADGFIGSHLTQMLLARGANVRALSYYNSFNSWGWLDDVPASPLLEVVSGDVRDPFQCQRLAADMDTVFHLAALIAIPFSYSAPSSYVDTNVKGTLNILEAARATGCRRVIHLSTSEVYGTARKVPIDESHPLQPQSPYSASKIGADSLALSYHSSFKLPVVIARPFNTFGPRQSARAIIPTVLTQVLSGATTVKIGDPCPTRDLTYVADTCRALVALAEADGVVGQTVNIGSNFEVSIDDLVKIIGRLLGKDIVLETDDIRLRPPNSEVFRLWCDNTKLRQLTGFSPELSFEDGLRQTVDWFSSPANLSKYKPGIYNV